MSKTLSVRVTDEEWKDFHEICARNHLSVQDLLHGMVVDALVDEGYVLQCRRQERRSASRETSKALGATET